MIEYLKKEIILSRQWLDRILNGVDHDWKESPSGLKTNINWQMGHLCTSAYFHGVICIKGSDAEIKEKVNPRRLAALYGMGSNPLENLDEKPDKDELLFAMDLIDQKNLLILDELKEEELAEEPIMKNPVASTKEEALAWNFKHRMWHTGQIALINSHFK